MHGAARQDRGVAGRARQRPDGDLGAALADPQVVGACPAADRLAVA
jgi:hypothetical protein